MDRTDKPVGKHPSYGNRTTPTLQLLSKLSKFNGTRHDNIVSAAAKPTVMTAPPLTVQTPGPESIKGSSSQTPSLSARAREETAASHVLDPNYHVPTVNAEEEATKHHSRYTTHMDSAVGKILSDAKNIVTPDEVFIPGKRRTGSSAAKTTGNVIGGITADGDPYQTTSQQMQAGMETEKTVGSRKKALRDFEPELFVSPITGEQIANYGTWAEDLKKQKDQKQSKTSDSTEEEDAAAEEAADPVMFKLRTQLKSRGAKGIISLGRLFKAMDDDGSGGLSFQEFKKAMREVGMSLSDAELIVLFKRFDLSNRQSISYNDFLVTIAGAMNLRRKRLVRQAFAVLDKTGDGIVHADDMAMAYDASKHPDVISGKRTPEQVLLEFLDGFDIGGTKDGQVTAQEFENYYNAISASIPRDDYFELMIRNAWHISGGEGAAANSANMRVLVTLSDGSQQVVEVKNDLGLNPKDKNAILVRLKAQGLTNVVSVSGTDVVENVEESASSGRDPRRPRTSGSVNAAAAAGSKRIPRSTVNDAVSRPAVAAPSAGITMLIDRIKKEMRSRGSAGFVGLQRRFRIMDDDGSKSLSLAEFKKALKEFKMDLSDGDLRMLFKHFDQDDSGSIDFEEFVQGVRDPLTARRLALVHQAFAVLDKDSSGIVDAAEIATMYDASKHPDVLAKRKTASQVLKEFLDTFDVGGVKDGMVTKDEFVNYYTNISANIDNEDYFELMIRNAWHIGGGEGAAANSTNLAVCVTNRHGIESVVTLQNDLGVTKNDISKIYARLRSQGVNDIYAIDGKVVTVLNVNGVDIVTIAGEAKQLNNEAPVMPKVLRAPPFVGRRPQSASARTPSLATAPPAPHPIAGSDRDPKATTTQSRGAVQRPSPARLAQSVQSGIQQQLLQRQQQTEDNIVFDTLMEVLRVQLLSKGSLALIDLQRKFVEMDSNNSKSLDKDEFRNAIVAAKLAFSNPQIDLLFNHIDRDQSGLIDYDEFLSSMRGPISPRLLVLIHKAFDQMDPAGRNRITPQDLMRQFNAARHPDVAARVRSEENVLREFLDSFDVGAVEPGVVTREEFVTYYHNVICAMGADNDDYMELVLRRCWSLGEDPKIVQEAERQTIQSFVRQQQQQRQPQPDQSVRRPSTASAHSSGRANNSANTGNFTGENSLKGRFSSAKNFADEYWAVDAPPNAPAAPAQRPMSAGGLRYGLSATAPPPSAAAVTGTTPRMQSSGTLLESRPPSAQSSARSRSSFAVTTPAAVNAAANAVIDMTREVNMDRLNYLKKEAVKHYNEQQYQEAEYLFTEALHLCQLLFPLNHPECLKAEKSILMVQRKLNQGHHHT